MKMFCKTAGKTAKNFITMMLLAIGFVIVTIANTSCDSGSYCDIKSPPIDTTEFESPEIPEIKGWGWKLIRMEVVKDFDFDNREVIDYSKYNIVYDFQFEEGYEKVDYHWTPPFKLTIYNYLPSAFYSNDVQSGGEHIYKYRQPSDYWYPDGTHTDYYCNLIIDGSEFDGIYLNMMSAYFQEDYQTSDIYKTTDTIFIGRGDHILDSENHPIGWISWTKYLVRIRD